MYRILVLSFHSMTNSCTPESWSAVNLLFLIGSWAVTRMNLRKGDKINIFFVRIFRRIAFSPVSVTKFFDDYSANTSFHGIVWTRGASSLLGRYGAIFSCTIGVSSCPYIIIPFSCPSISSPLNQNEPSAALNIAYWIIEYPA